MRRTIVVTLLFAAALLLGAACGDEVVAPPAGGDTTLVILPRSVPITVGDPASPAAEAFRMAAERLAAQLSIASYKKSAIPLMPVR